MGYYLDGQPLQPLTLIMPTVGACQDLHGQTAAVYSLTSSLPAQAFMLKCETGFHEHSPAQAQMMRRFSLLLLILALLGAVISYLMFSPGMGSRSTQGSAVDKEIPVTVAQANRGPIAQVLYGSGELRPVNEVDVVSRIAGAVSEIRYKVGDSVTEGQVVATVRPKDLLQGLEQIQAAVKAAHSNLRAKEDQLLNVEKQLERTRELRDGDLIARRGLEQAEAAADTARAQRELAQAQAAQQEATLAQARYLLEFSKLAAPSSGLVTHRWVEPGAQVENSEPILTLGSLDRLKVTLKIPQTDRDLSGDEMTAQLQVDALPGRIFKGKARQVKTVAEAGGRTAIVEIHVLNPDRSLKPGMTASVSLVLGKSVKAP